MPAPPCAPVSLPRAQRCLSIPTQPPISASVLELAWHLEREAPAARHADRPKRVSWPRRSPRRCGGCQEGGRSPGCCENFLYGFPAALAGGTILALLADRSQPSTRRSVVMNGTTVSPPLSERHA